MVKLKVYERIKKSKRMSLSKPVLKEFCLTETVYEDEKDFSKEFEHWYEIGENTLTDGYNTVIVYDNCDTAPDCIAYLYKGTPNSKKVSFSHEYKTTRHRFYRQYGRWKEINRTTFTDGVYIAVLVVK